MDKKKVKELSLDVLDNIKEAMSKTDDTILGLKLANIASKIALIGVEVNKSDWVSVEDGLPGYDENVEVCSKMKPTEVWIDSRDKYIDVGNSFRCNKLYGNAITHWKPIEKLEE